MLIVDKHSCEPLYIQIYQQLKDKIISGELCEGNVLPPIRTLARTLMVARNTVDSAYQQLCSEGYIIGKVGSGYKVQKIDMPNMISPNAELLNFTNIVEEVQASDIVKYDFQYGKLDVANFPLRIWRRLLNHVLLSDEIGGITDYNEKKGDLALRIQIMKYLRESRGVVCRSEQIILCSGAMSAVSLICKLFDTKTVAVEEPSFDSAREIFINHGYRINPVTLTSDGIDLEQLKLLGEKLLYTTPSHQFPTGVVMPINKRLHLLDWANQNSAYIIEDDYDSELRYNSRPIPSIHSLDQNDRVIYINSFSKALAPGLRMGFIVLPQALLEKYQSNFSNYSCSIPWLEQKTMYHFMEQGHWNRFLNKILVSNKRKHDTLISTINSQMGKHTTIHGKNAGLHILLEVDNGMSEYELIEAASKVDVRVYPVSRYWINTQNYLNNMVLIGYSSLSENEIVEGIARLSSAWF
ncbi:PLP-dependent aminotransferase family protein [uncultured Dysgonomonas sp.]|uniref:MocR-like pyridoxine biosynthesis transcription factor PdxR n=1 Tax=uncultured Dysgonomonas sp. TaxID=206096 RepID=UPI00263A2725|nr:PLP-dependent aminotransferase family protein [uncultured Dysgonomonas sp.]